MTTYGVTLQGFRAKRLADIKAEMEASFKDTFGAGVNLDPREPFGQQIGIQSEREAAVWALAEAVYLSQYPDTAEGVNLDNVVALTGISRKQKTKSKTKAYLIGIAGTVVPAGSIASVLGNASARFVTNLDNTILPATNEIQHLQFSLVPDANTFAITLDIDETAILAYNAAAIDIQNALNALPGITGAVVTGAMPSFDVEFAGANAATPYPLMTITSNTLTSTSIPVTGLFTENQLGAPPEVFADLTAETAGPVQAPSGSLSVIETPVSGWNSIMNPLDAVVGADLETDAELRIRRSKTVSQSGASTTEAIRANLLNTADVRAALVFENRDSIPDIDGRPAHSFECVVQGGLDADISQVIFDDKPAGIQTDGTTTVPITDSQGFVVPIKFSRPTQVPIYLELDVSTTSAFPADGVTEIKSAVIAYGLTLGLGDDVIVSPHLIASMNDIPGITNIVVRIGIAPSPTLPNNIIIALAEIAAFDTSRITVNLV